MQALAARYREMCMELRDQPLILLSDIDGTILDMRHMILSVLQSYDRNHKTQYFQRIRAEDITCHENRIEELLEALHIPSASRQGITDYYLESRWSEKVTVEGHRPFLGVLEVIRWFQLQPNTSVGLVTGRPESLRESTLRSLNILGSLHRVEFTNELLFMNANEGEHTTRAKVEGLKHFRDAGYAVFAFIDNEPENLRAVSRIDPNLLLLHANTIFESRSRRVPHGAVRGKEYRVQELVRNEKDLPRGVQMVWHGVNDEPNLRQFLASNVHWAEVDARLEPFCSDAILRHDPTSETALKPSEDLLSLDTVLGELREHRRAVKIDLKGGDELIDRVVELVSNHGFDDAHLWFNGAIQNLREAGFRRLAAAYPEATVQCPVDFLAPLILAAPEKAHDVLDTLRDWCINRFSLSWQPSDLKGADQREVFDRLDQWGFQVNIYNVDDLEAFLHAVLLLPRSVTADYNFPRWHHYGRGSGGGGLEIDYAMRRKASQHV